MPFSGGRMTRSPKRKTSRTPVVTRPAPKSRTKSPQPEEVSESPQPDATPPAAIEPAAPAAESGIAIRVDIESELTGWRTGSRFDVVLRGQIISGSPAASFVIRDPAGNDLASVEFGHGSDTEAVALPEGGTGFRTGFQIFLPLPGGDEVRIADMWVRAETRDGAVFEEAMRLGCIADQAAILAGPARDLSGIEMPVPHGILYLEGAEIDGEGFLRADGWTLSTSPIVAVQFFAAGDRVGAGGHGRDRSDVGDAYPGYPNAHHAGFLLERHVDRSVRNAGAITVQVLCLNGACYAATIPLAHTAGDIAPPVRPPTGKIEPPPPAPAAPAWDLGRAIILICDQATLISPDVLRVDGWTACGHGIERVAIEVDGKPHGDAEYGHERQDVAAEYPGMPAGTGFAFEKLIPGLSGGPHQVRIIAISRVGDEKDVAMPVVDPATPAFRFELDIPATRDGIAIDPITGRMTIEGWALARDGMAAIDVALDGVALGPAHFGVVRPDVGAAFPAWSGAARSGYTFHCPSRALPDGDHAITLTARSKAGDTHVHSFRITVKKTEDPEETASIRRKISQVERDTLFAVLDGLAWRPMFHVIVTGDASLDDKARGLTIRSIMEQSWPEWRVTILASGRREARAVRALTGRFAAEETARFRVIEASDKTAWNAPLGSRDGAELVAVLAMGDEAGRDALGAFAIATGLHPHADCLYADDFRLAEGHTRPEAFFKPDFSPALLMSTNYIGRPLVVRPRVMAAADVTPAALMRDGSYDLVLRCTEAASSVHHVRELLSRTDGGAAANKDDGAAALTGALARRGIAAELLPGMAPSTWRARRTAPVTGKVSIIIPTCAAKGYIETCLKTLRETTAYRNFEIVCIDNIPAIDEVSKAFVRAHADKIVEMPAPFNWSRFNNRAADAADGDYLLFLNDDVEITEPGWLDAMLEDAAQPEVGIVGARLLYPNRTVQHAGMFLGAGIGRHAFRFADEAEPGYFGLALTRREVIAVTGACLLVRREVFDRLGGFDEAHEIVNNDLDFCLRAHRAGLRTIYTPYATLIHHELASRENLLDTFDTTRFTGAWSTLFAAGDPYFNPHLSRNADDYQVEDEDIQAVFSGHPLIHRDEVKRILVVKLDHIGDFITSLPAIRRLKKSFPGAQVTVLAAPASTAFAKAEPAIDEFIPFEFFHERSELGEKELTRDDLDALTDRLAPYRFDIAVDLRKHLSTRHILRCSGARILAGYDSLDRFPWLDIALEWEGDKALQHKRNHITDDLLNLVAAIEAASETNRKLIDPRPAPMAVDELPEHARHVFSRPVVAIHPGAGNVTKQWPEARFLALIDLLIERNGVSVLLIGGKDDVEIASSIIERSANRERIASVAGEVPLRELPRLVAACTLYIGTDSGPKHIAAAMGVPTIGVHSGVVDPGEWAPIGERSVAMYRNMNCSPCYLSKAEDCPRGLACIQMLEPALVHRMAETFLARPVAPMPVVCVPVVRVPVVPSVVARGRKKSRRARTVAAE
jgi:ADP-heptose:LPS heptosyltransferase/GT2 family glycosyltransferase